MAGMLRLLMMTMMMLVLVCMATVVVGPTAATHTPVRPAQRQSLLCGGSQQRPAHAQSHTIKQTVRMPV